MGWAADGKPLTDSKKERRPKSGGVGSSGPTARDTTSQFEEAGKEKKPPRTEGWRFTELVWYLSGGISRRKECKKRRKMLRAKAGVP